MNVTADTINRQNAGRLIVGMGTTGLSMARWLYDRQLPFRVVDSRSEPPQYSAIEALCPRAHIAPGRWPADWFAAADDLYVSPGVPLADPDIARALSRGARLHSDVALYCQSRETPLIAVTGSNGKSTVVTWLVEAARAAGINALAGGNIGTPVLDLLNRPHELAVLELSSFQLEMISQLDAQVALVLNVSPDHMDRYEHFSDYRAAKHRIFRGCQAAVINTADPDTWPEAMPPAIVRYSPQAAVGAPGGALSLVPGESGTALFRQGECLWRWARPWSLKGRHNRLNALAVLAVAELLEWPLDRVAPVMAAFRGLPHRCEWVGEAGGITFINDSKGTNVGATLAALSGLSPECPGRMHVLLGGLAKGADFRPLVDGLRRPAIVAYCFGAAGAELHDLCAATGVPCAVGKTLQEAFGAAVSEAGAGDWVLLSPACASMDQFDDYRARGDAFRACVERFLAWQRPLEVRS